MSAFKQVEAQCGSAKIISAHRPGARIRGTGRVSQHASCDGTHGAIDVVFSNRACALAALRKTNYTILTYGKSSHIHVGTDGWRNGTRTLVARRNTTRARVADARRSGARSASRRRAGVRVASAQWSGEQNGWDNANWSDGNWSDSTGAQSAYAKRAGGRSASRRRGVRVASRQRSRGESGWGDANWSNGNRSSTW